MLDGRSRWVPDVNTQPLLVLTTFNSSDEAHEFACAAVESRLAACVNTVTGVTSVYRWQDQIEHSNEVLLIIKTTASRYAALEAEILARSSYDLPEIVAVPIERGLSEYLTWVRSATKP